MPRQQEKSPSVPGWILSFSDMITLLLSFFVLLQSFASVQEPALFYAGQGSFKRAIDGFGLPSWFLGVKERPYNPHMNVVHPPEETQEERERTVYDPKDEQIRAQFQKIKEQMTTEAGDYDETAVGSPRGFEITYDESGCRLTDESKRMIVEYAQSLIQTVDRGELTVYVMGFATEGRDREAQWMLSARRAQEVQEVLREQFQTATISARWRVLGWGGGDGEHWSRSLGMDPHRTSIAISLMGAK